MAFKGSRSNNQNPELMKTAKEYYQQYRKAGNPAKYCLQWAKDAVLADTYLNQYEMGLGLLGWRATCGANSYDS